MAKADYDSFTQRLADTFAGLGNTAVSSAPEWQPSQQQVFRGGDADAHSSEDDDDTQPQLDLPEGLLQMDTPGDEEFQQRPATAAFCRAVDREEEYDAVDEVAQGRDSIDDRPAGSTQVLPDNAYEREGSPALAGPAEPSGAEAVNFGRRGEPPIQQPSPAAQSHCSSTDETGSGNGTRKRVRFAAYVPPQQRSAEGIGLAQGSSSLRSSLKQRPGRPASRTGRASTSTVPEHVQYPDRFTVYELDQPLTVGGGDSTANHRPQPSSVTIEEVEPSSTEEQRELPSFGSGIEFRPQHRVTGDDRQPAEHQEPGGHSEHAAAGIAAPALSFLQDDPMDSEDAGGAANVQLAGGSGEHRAVPKAPRQRNYRNRR